MITPEQVKEHIKIVRVSTVDMSVRLLLFEQLRYFHEKGYDLTVVCSDGPLLDGVREAGIRIHNIPIERNVAPLADVVSLFRLTRFLRRERPHIVQTHMPKANLLGRIAARLAGVPVVIGTEHGFFFYNKTGISRLLYTWVARIGARLSDRVFLYNEEDMRLAREQKIGRPSIFMHLRGGSGVDAVRFAPGRFDRAWAKERLGIEAGAPVVGIVARLSPEKGFAEFFRAGGMTLKEVENTHFLVIGPSEGDSRAEFERAAREAGIRERTHFLGMRTDVVELYSAMDMYVLPSYREGLSRSLMEASAMGLPSVTTDVRGCRDVVTHGETGLIVPPRDADALAAAVVRLLKNPAERERMGKAARERALEVFDVRRVYEQVEKTYIELLKEKGLL